MPEFAQGPSMNISRRRAVGILAGSIPALRYSHTLVGQSAPGKTQIANGPFQPDARPLSAYEVPAWFRDAKFGIWAHWGPQSSVEAGDWYARNMYIQGQRQYDYLVTTYGHPSKFGYKDLIPLWKGEKFDADHLVGLYK